MKTRQFFLTVLLIVMGAVAHATDGVKNPSTEMKVTPEKENVYRLLYKGNPEAKVTINIWDANEKLVFTENIKTFNAFVRPYNFSNLAKGIYTLEVVEGNKTSRKTIYHGVSEIAHIKWSEELITTPVIRMAAVASKDGVYKLTIVNQGERKATIRIYDSKKRILYSAVESFENVFCKLYNVKGLNEKATVVIEINGNVNQYVL